MITEINRLSNDLYAELPRCKCGAARKRTGYYDNYFFSKVNAAPSFAKCFGCGQEYGYKWEIINGAVCVRLWEERCDT